MKLVDANILLYAVNEDSLRHVESRAWLDDALNGGASIGFSWLVTVAFVRLSTKAGLFDDPLSVDDAIDRVEAWLAEPPSVAVEPTARHLPLVRDLLDSTGGGGNLVNDAHLAALSIEHRAEIVSYDNDFARFAGVVWEQPPPID